MMTKQHFPYGIDLIWKIVSNTEQTNRTIGLGKVAFENVAKDDSQLLRRAKAKILGIAAEWTEHPFEWQRGQKLSVLRVYQKGLYRELTLQMDLKSGGSGTDLEVTVQIKPRNILLRPLMWFICRAYCKKLFAYVTKIAKLSSQDLRVEIKGRGAVTPSSLFHLEKSLRKLQDGEHATMLAKVSPILRNHLVQAQDLDVVEMQPLALGSQWNISETEAIRLFCESAKVGVLEATWTLLCPTCRVPKDTATEMRQLPDSFHCDLCDVDIGADLSENVELRFRVSPSIRSIDQSTYCIGSPSRTRHIEWQGRLAPGQTAHISIPTVKGKFNLRLLQSNRRFDVTPTMIEQAASGALQISLQDSQWICNQAGVAAKPGLTLSNDTNTPVVVAFERSERDPLALTAVKVLHFAEFRKLFAIDALTPGRSIAVKNLTVLFTDLVGSTAMYESIGDATAYGKVQRHFDLLAGVCQEHAGKIVKTIGDAVMATFTNPIDGLKAGFAIQQLLPKFNRDLDCQVPIRLRIGVHTGPVIAVTANDKVDFFGRTINIASRVEHEGEADAVIISESVWQDEEVQQYLATQTISRKDKSAQLKGIDRPFQMFVLKNTAPSVENQASTNIPVSAPAAQTPVQENHYAEPASEPMVA